MDDPSSTQQLDDPLALAFLIAGYVIIALGIGALGFLSLAEAALLGMSDIRLRALRANGDRRVALIKRLVEDNEFLNVIIIGVNVCIIVISTVTTVLVARAAATDDIWHAEPWREEAVHIGMLLVLLVLAEIGPKTYGALYADRCALAVAGPMTRLIRLVGPPMRVFTAIAHAILRAVGVRVAEQIELVTRDEIRAAADVGEEEGALEPEEGEMIDNVLELSVARASDVMVPRVDIVALEETKSLDEVLQIIGESGHSRIPIYSRTIDSITGVLYLTDLLIALRDGAAEIDVRELARAPVYVPESKPLDELFAEMRERAIHLAIVVDEFGGTEGLVSIEDILEQLVGEIDDEHDVVTEDILVLSETEAVVSARLRIESLNDAFDLDLPEDEYDTVGGLVTGLAGHMPIVGEAFEIDGVVLRVEQVDEQYVERVHISVKYRDSGEN